MLFVDNHGYFSRDRYLSEHEPVIKKDGLCAFRSCLTCDRFVNFFCLCDQFLIRLKNQAKKMAINQALIMMVLKNYWLLMVWKHPLKDGNGLKPMKKHGKSLREMVVRSHQKRIHSLHGYVNQEVCVASCDL